MENEPMTPDERRTFEELVAVVQEELAAQIAIRRLEGADGEHRTATTVADAVWNNFELHPRSKP